MKIVFDTNVIIDAVASREPFHREAEAILLMASEEKIKGYLTANSITDIFYVARRSLPETEARGIIRSLIYSLEVIEVGGADCWEALSLPISDFEDALIVMCAKKVEADYIISRDNNLLKVACPVQVISPSEFLARYS